MPEIVSQDAYMVLCKRLFIFLLLLIANGQVGAIHLVGGSLSYEYEGQTSWGDPQYRIKLRMYRDAVPPTTAFDPDVTIGIYNDDANNSLEKTINIDYSGEGTLSFPELSEDCAFSPNLDFRVSTYETVTTIPDSDQGYHLAFVRCCRNDLLNLKPNMGQTYYAYIPPPNQFSENSSAQFADTPVPYVCIGDTINISYGTNDPDADSLAYSFVKPYHGADSALPKPGPPSNLNFPIQKVQFDNGYNTSEPFGPNGVAKIDSSSGIATFYIPNQGKYALAVEIREYRNGTLVGVTRRDLQFIGINCPENDPPDQFDTLNTSVKTTYSIKEGDTLEFPILFEDEDTMNLSYSGPIFNSSGAIDPPYANIGNPVGKDTIGTEFYWPSSCGHGRDQPYFIDVQVKDEGCPPKTTRIRYTINVEGYDGVDSIEGDDSLCIIDPAVGYKAHLPDNNLDPVYWEAEGGEVVSTPSRKKAMVKWTNEGSELKAWSENDNGCTGDTTRLPVDISDPSAAHVDHDTAFCHGDSATIGKSPDQFPDSAEILWLDSTYLDSTRSPNPVFKGTNFGLSSKTYEVKAKINYLNCEFIDTVEVTVKPRPTISQLNGQEWVCHDEVYSYSVPNSNEGGFYWYVQGGHLQDTVTPDPEIPVRWQNTDSGMIQVQKRNEEGCISDTFSKPINIENPYIDTVFGPTVVCPNSSNMRYRVDSKYAHYHWDVDSATLEGQQGPPRNKISYGDSGNAFIYVQEETANGCVSDTFTLPVDISYHLETTPIMGDTSVCEFSVKNYQVEDRNGSTFSWFLTGGSELAPNGNHQVKVEWGSAPNRDAMLKVLETSYDSVNDKECKGDTIRQPITINPNPETGDIRGDSTICKKKTATFHVKGFENSSYFWEVADAGSLVWQRGDTVKIRGDSVGECLVSVFELTEDSCKSPLITKSIEVLPKPEPKTISGPETLCIPYERNYRFHYPGEASSRYDWIPGNGEVVARNSGGREVHTRWNTGGATQISVLETNEDGCVGDTVTKDLSIDQYDLQISHVTTRKQNDSVIEIHGTINSHAPERQTALYRKLPDKEWHFEDSLEAGSFVYPDFEPQPSENYHDYHLGGLDACAQEQKSIPHRTIHLSGNKTESNDLNLHWNHYQGWGNELSGYEVYRKLDEADSFERIETLGSSDTTIHLDADTNGYRQCYRIKGINDEKEGLYSWSNITCFPFESRVRIPNAFTPTISGDLNDLFRVEGYNVQEFHMEIYNRWGAKLFESDRLEKGWDGKHKGKMLPKGVYVVIINHKGAIEEKTYKGTITILK